MNFELMKKVTLLSVFVGFVIGLITLVPYINLFSFLFLTFLIAPALIIYLKMNNMLGIVDTREGAIIGAIIGIASFTGFFILFTPLSALIGLLYKNGVYVVMKWFFSSGGGIMVLILAFLMIGSLIALFNAFSGTFTAYLYQEQQKLHKEQNQNFQIENKG